MKKGSLLKITSVGNLQEEIIKTVKENSSFPGIYVSLNKTQKNSEEILNQNRIDTKDIFFIDCVESETTGEDVIHIPPHELNKLSYAIQRFIKEIKDEKFLIIDALSTLLIYNDVDEVASFVKELTEYIYENKVRMVAFSPKTMAIETPNAAPPEIPKV